MPTLQLTVDGMTCQHCAARLKRVLEAVAGVTAAEIALKMHQVTVEFDAAATTSHNITAAINDSGFTVLSSPTDALEDR